MCGSSWPPPRTFAKVFYAPGADVSDVAALACKAFPRWRLDAGQARLFLAAKAGEPKPQLPPAPGALTGLEQLAEEATLEGAGVAPGAWLVAAPTSPGGPGGGSTPQCDLASAIAVLDAKVAALAQQVRTGSSGSPLAAPRSAAPKPRRYCMSERSLELPPIAHLMPPPRSLVPFPWGAEREATASPSLLQLLQRWVEAEDETVFLDVPGVAARSLLVTREPGIGSFKGVPDLTILRHGCRAHCARPLSHCAAAVDWRTPAEMSGRVTGQVFLQALALSEIAAADAPSPPVFFTDLASQFLCCRVFSGGMLFYEGAAGRQLSLEEGVGLLRHFLLLDKARGVANLAGVHCKAAGGRGATAAADVQAQQIAEVQDIAVDLTHKLTAYGGVSRTAFCVQE